MNRKILNAAFSVILVFAIVQTSFAQTQSHPLSQITPIDINLDMYQKNITNVSYAGIGTATPEYNLHVIGNGYVSSDLIIGGNLYFGVGGPYLYSSSGLIYTSSGVILGGNLNLQNNLLSNARLGSNLDANSYSIFGADWVNGTNFNVSNQLCLGGICKTSWPSNLVGGSGTANYIAVWVDSSNLGDSWLYQSGSDLVLSSSYNFNLESGSLKIGGTSVIDSSRNLVNVNQITASGPVNIDSGTLYVDSSNDRVGIGTTSPGAKLHVASLNDAILVEPTSMSGGEVTRLKFADPDGGTKPVYFEYLDNGNAALGFLGGNFGVGTNDPTYKLTVIGDINATGFVKGSELCIGNDCRTTWPDVTGESGWTDEGTYIRLTTSTDKVIIGADYAPQQKLDVIGNLNVTGSIYEGNQLLSSKYVPQTRQINTGTGLTGGGSLSSDLTLSIDTSVVPQKSIDESIEGVWNFAKGLKVAGGYDSGGLTIDDKGNILTHGNLTYSGYTYVIDTLEYNGTGNFPFGINVGGTYEGSGYNGFINFNDSAGNLKGKIYTDGTNLIIDAKSYGGSISMVGGINMNNNAINNVNSLTIADPGPGEGLLFSGTTANWRIDVTPRDRSNADGNLNLYGTANSIVVWRPLEPSSDDSIDLGSSTYRFKDAYFSGTVHANAFEGAISANNVEDIWVNETGDTMSGDLNMADNNILDVNTIQANNLEDPEDTTLQVSDNLYVTGSLGVGVSPSYKLHVSGAGKNIVEIESPQTSSQAGIRFFRTGTNDYANIYIENYSGNVNLHRLVIESSDDGDSDYIVFRNHHWDQGDKDVMEIHRSYITANATLRPLLNNYYDLGTSSYQWANIYGVNIYQNGNQVIDTINSGNGISVSGSGNSRTIAIKLYSGSGLIADSTGLSLNRSCSAGQVLKWDGNSWYCANDENSGGTVSGSGTANALAYWLDSSTLADLSFGSSGQFLKSQGSGNLPVWDTIDLGTDTEGNYVAGVTAGVGLTGGGSGEGISVTLNVNPGWGLTTDSSTDTINLSSSVAGTGLDFNAGVLSVKYGSSAGTAAEGNKQITVSAGSGLAGGGTITIGSGGSVSLSHADTSSQASVSNTGGTVIQNVSLDDYGHVTKLQSVDLDNRYYTKSEADSRFVNVAGDSMTGDLNMQDHNLLDANTVQANTLEDPEDAWLYVNDNLEVNGNVRGNRWEDRQNTGGYIDLWIDSVNGGYINFPDNAWGGSGDDAYIRYYNDSSGENTRLLFYIGNDAADDMYFKASGPITFESTVSNYVQSLDELRAPRFVDKDDTSYYLDPASSTSSLKVAGGIELSGSANTGVNLNGVKILVTNYDNDDSNPTSIIFARDENGYVDFFINSSTTQGGQPLMYFRGKVGIGTISPSYTLDVAGDIHASGTIYASTLSGDLSCTGCVGSTEIANGAIKAEDLANPLGGSINASAYYDSDNSAYYLDPSNAGTSALFAGKVGIATTSISQTLDVNGNIATQNIYLNKGQSEGSIYYIEIIKGYDDIKFRLGSNSYFYFQDSGGTTKAWIDYKGNAKFDGNITLGSGTYNEINNIRGLRLYYTGDDTQVSTTSTEYTTVKQTRIYFDSDYGIRPRYITFIASIWNSGDGTTYLKVCVDSTCSEKSTGNTDETFVEGSIDVSSLSEGVHDLKIYLKATAGTAYHKYIDIYYVF